MFVHAETRTLRQARCIRRSARARGIAWLLMPVTAAVFSAALWSDPVLQPQLKSGLDDVRPLLSALMGEGVPDTEARAPQDATVHQAPDDSAEIAGLPVSRTPVNRPGNGD